MVWCVFYEDHSACHLQRRLENIDNVCNIRKVTGTVNVSPLFLLSLYSLPRLEMSSLTPIPSSDLSIVIIWIFWGYNDLYRCGPARRCNVSSVTERGCGSGGLFLPSLFPLNWTPSWCKSQEEEEAASAKAFPLGSPPTSSRRSSESLVPRQLWAQDGGVVGALE